jgi:two-component system, sporulation sensor kinase E
VALNRINAKRLEAEAAVMQTNAELERRVEERSAELIDLLHQFKQSEEKYASLIEHASDAIYLLDGKGDFMEANESMCKMTGYTKVELLQMNVANLIDTEQLKTDPLIIGSILLNSSTIRERRFTGKNGCEFVVEINAKRLDDDTILVIARNVTDRKRMEAELRDAEIKFRTLAEKSLVGVYIVQKGKFVYVNPRFASVFGYEPNEMINTIPVENVVQENFRERSSNYVRRRLNLEIDNIHYETVGLKKDGSTNWVEFYGNTVIIEGQPTIIGSMLDITERKNAEEELRVSEQKYKLLLKITQCRCQWWQKMTCLLLL